jgi:hypothetical protein
MIFWTTLPPEYSGGGGDNKRAIDNICGYEASNNLIKINTLISVVKNIGMALIVVSFF